ncbi:MAG: amino acid ABC transporter permease [Cyanobacteria bacterium J06627_32]
MNFNFHVIWNNFLPLFYALFTTIWISLGSILLGSVVGVLMGLFSLSSIRIIAVAAKIFIEFFLALPALVALVWLYYSLPLLIPGFILTGESCAVLGLGLSLSAFVADIVRAGINAIPMGEIEAAYCTGMTRMEAVRYILVPQVFRKSWFPLMGQYITTYKFSTLSSIIAVPEILHTANSIIAQTYRPIEIYSAVAVIFLFTVMPLNILLRGIERVERFGGIERI